MTNVLIVFYSTWGHMHQMAKAVEGGAKSIKGTTVRLRQVAELIPKEKWDEGIKKAKEMMKNVPIATNEDLEWADGIVFGTPTRYGNMASQMKQFIDQTGNLWQKNALVDKVAGFFTSTASIHGGQETTLITSMIPMLHLGMIIVGIPYTETKLFALEGGGTPYGASTVTGGDGSRMPSENELEIAKTLGKRVATIAKKISS